MCFYLSNKGFFFSKDLSYKSLFRDLFIRLNVRWRFLCTSKLIPMYDDIETSLYHSRRFNYTRTRTRLQLHVRVHKLSRPEKLFIRIGFESLLARISISCLLNKPPISLQYRTFYRAFISSLIVRSTQLRGKIQFSNCISERMKEE